MKKSRKPDFHGRICHGAESMFRHVVLMVCGVLLHSHTLFHFRNQIFEKSHFGKQFHSAVMGLVNAVGNVRRKNFVKLFPFSLRRYILQQLGFRHSRRSRRSVDFEAELTGETYETYDSQPVRRKRTLGLIRPKHSALYVGYSTDQIYKLVVYNIIIYTVASKIAAECVLLYIRRKIHLARRVSFIIILHAKRSILVYFFSAFYLRRAETEIDRLYSVLRRQLQRAHWLRSRKVHIRGF